MTLRLTVFLAMFGSMAFMAWLYLAMVTQRVRTWRAAIRTAATLVLAPRTHSMILAHDRTPVFSKVPALIDQRDHWRSFSRARDALEAC